MTFLQCILGNLFTLAKSLSAASSVRKESVGIFYPQRVFSHTQFVCIKYITEDGGTPKKSDSERSFAPADRDRDRQLQFYAQSFYYVCPCTIFVSFVICTSVCLPAFYEVIWFFNLTCLNQPFVLSSVYICFEIYCFFIITSFFQFQLNSLLPYQCILHFAVLPKLTGQKSK